jgi:hypothetical protein
MQIQLKNKPITYINGLLTKAKKILIDLRLENKQYFTDNKIDDEILSIYNDEIKDYFNQILELLNKLYPTETKK